ncbi:class I SAM-dependent methyltransferase [Lichenicoccus roseus]|uniref:Class I SAM-dependent methyltransferase n=1 Tax=Lichenicoccus roseus TaxID=2683649 RepID=A0A5R9JI69_9PROT|nr:class I SAM-dependent methyltransferase [Lichenicoccus roseus]TLU74018.1 class I SAM-dependent methyltransferase [Lichenicoccus roseus]
MTQVKRAVRFALARAARMPGMQRPAFAAFARLFPDQPWQATHPFDRGLGTDTGGFVPQWLLQPGVTEADQGSPYAGCQPECVRAALASLPDTRNYSFIDLGCGKGRAMIVASEYSFHAILGVELSGGLVAVAARNAALVARAHPERTRLQPMQGDAAGVALPDGPLVIFNYHAFPRALVGRIAERLAAAASPGREIFYVYENPVCHYVLDALPGFTRWFAAKVACTDEERGRSPGDEDTVVVWRAGGPPRTAHDGADAGLRETVPGWGVELHPGLASGAGIPTSIG